MEETSQDIGFTRNNQWFRYRAAGIIIKDDAVLMVGNDHNDYYYSVGGAVQLGETAEEACPKNNDIFLLQNQKNS